MPLLTGAWTFALEGHEGALNINSVSSTGQVDFSTSVPSLGIGFGQEFRSGFWDESSQNLTLHVTVFAQFPSPDPNQPDPLAFQYSLWFEGHQFPTPAQPLPGQDVVWTLVGHVIAVGGPQVLNPSARRHRFGWRASLSQTL
jgi:hypothetical protein